MTQGHHAIQPVEPTHPGLKFVLLNLKRMHGVGKPLKGITQL
jgi:hypothetical protein